MWSTAEIAGMVGVSQRTVRSWLDRGWLTGRNLNGRFWVVGSQQLADFLLGRADAFRAWVEGQTPYRPAQWWSLTWKGRRITVGIHYQVEPVQVGSHPYRVTVWYVVEVETVAERPQEETLGPVRMGEDGRLYRLVSRPKPGREPVRLRTQRRERARQAIMGELLLWERVRYRSRTRQAQGWHGPNN